MSGSRYHARNLTFQLSFRAQQNDPRMRMIAESRNLRLHSRRQTALSSPCVARNPKIRSAGGLNADD
jgi:hypothetical protein